MKISYDKETDALYIRLVDGKHECRTLRLTDDIALNLGEGDLLVGIEVLKPVPLLVAEPVLVLVVELVPVVVRLPVLVPVPALT